MDFLRTLSVREEHAHNVCQRFSLQTIIPRTLLNPQSHLTRKNHDTLKAESAIPARPQTSASRVDSGVGVAEKVLPLVAADTEDDAIAVGTRLKMDGFLLYAYNVTASDALPLDREVPDTRPEG